MDIGIELQQRIEEEGFEIAFNPPSDGSGFYRAAAFQLGFKLEILHNLIFDYLESYQFDVSYFINVSMCKWLRDREKMMTSMTFNLVKRKQTEWKFFA